MSAPEFAQRSETVRAAHKVIENAWVMGRPYDLASQAAFALESACLLQSPETAAEQEREVRESVALAIEARGRAFLPTHPVFPYVGVFAAIARGSGKTDPAVGQLLAPADGKREAAKARVRAKVAAAKAMPARERIYHLLCATHSPAEAEAMLAEITEAHRAVSAPADVTVFRAQHDSIPMGLYTSREAAQAHCEAKVQQEEPAGSIGHLSWWADPEEDDPDYELSITPAETGQMIRSTGYRVTPLTVAAAYDAEADE